MDKWKRSARLVDMTQLLLSQPYKLIPLTTFAERYLSAKSSISEDLAIIHEVIHNEGNGELETLAGAAGGVRYIPKVNKAYADDILSALCKRLSDPKRILPGGFLYLSDLLGDTTLIQDIGRIFATLFRGQKIDAVMTVETKGIPLAHATASFLRVPVVIARYDYRVTEGSVVTVNTVSLTSKRMRQLSLSKRSLAEGSRVLIIDDFMKAGGTVQGMIHLLNEFQAEVVGVGVMMEAPAVERVVDQYVSLTSVKTMDIKNQRVEVEFGNFQL
ncbi:pur operon repressor [Hazenella sp. IB182357]|uniref:Pur operon repressor n=1 Tax=Polycladospora coralii TaxID=2771432 RepID=A0A926N657_9BACL|nr:pur operon repressor [Polycladospora coralii]MBD1372469.1 pur operon repressor [Polycladospora coralii]MBS7531791.1 pur operon repressor [Polycladospora coralii]